MNIDCSVLGIELGSTRIKAVLLDENRLPVASGSFNWESRLENGIWTYSLSDAEAGLKACFADLKRNFEEKFGTPLTKIGAIGISGMMHGFLAFDKEMKQVAPFRTWRNTVTSSAAEILSNAFNFNIPQRWSIAHLYQDILDQKSYINDIAFFTTLAGYIHFRLTGEKVLGLDEASGMFPIDTNTLNYRGDLLDKFADLTKDEGLAFDLRDILPKVLPAGQRAGVLTEEGARILDPTGTLCAEIPFAPPEGDAGTGMVATNSVTVGTGNVSAGTSIFAMVVTDKPLKKHREIDIVTTPAGANVAMIHCNNCTSDINEWVNLFYEFSRAMGQNVNIDEIYTALFNEALKGDNDCGGLLSYNYISGEDITGVKTGAPVFLRSPDSKITLANLMRTHIYSCFATLKIGLELLSAEGVKTENLLAHGGLFKTPEVAQRFLSAATRTKVTVAKTAGEGGPYGMALLAAYLLDKNGQTLEEYLNEIFTSAKSVNITATPDECRGFDEFIERYKNCFEVEKTASEIKLC